MLPQEVNPLETMLKASVCKTENQQDQDQADVPLWHASEAEVGRSPPLWHLLLFDENKVITITNLNQFDENSVITITNLNQFDDHNRLSRCQRRKIRQRSSRRLKKRCMLGGWRCLLKCL